MNKPTRKQQQVINELERRIYDRGRFEAMGCYRPIPTEFFESQVKFWNLSEVYTAAQYRKAYESGLADYAFLVSYKTTKTPTEVK
jgi:hypothetical protein